LANIGTIKSITKEDGQIVAIVQAGTERPNDESCIVMGLGGVECHPLPGDVVVWADCGRENVIRAVIRDEQEAGLGESILFSRDSDGNVVASIHLKADGGLSATVDGGGWEMASDGTFIVNGGNLEVLP
jgi:hypothetical protein